MNKLTLQFTTRDHPIISNNQGCCSSYYSPIVLVQLRYFQISCSPSSGLHLSLIFGNFFFFGFRFDIKPLITVHYICCAPFSSNSIHWIFKLSFLWDFFFYPATLLNINACLLLTYCKTASTSELLKFFLLLHSCAPSLDFILAFSQLTFTISLCDFCLCLHTSPPFSAGVHMIISDNTFNLQGQLHSLI